ncbi:Uncharacterised protein [Bordetella pertussis]|nr:Uncharacterised protein [Bordetella pertussis]
MAGCVLNSFSAVAEKLPVCAMVTRVRNCCMSRWRTDRIPCLDLLIILMVQENLSLVDAAPAT